jgi:uncharacterized damage-inducible protein DinB
MLNSIETFIKYFHGQRRRTNWVIDVMPPEKADWRPWSDEPSPAEILRRIGAGHLMYATVVAHNYWYVEDFENTATSWEQSCAYLQRKTDEALDLLRDLPDSTLQEKRKRPDNNPPTFAWRYLMTMLEHEIAHRSQLNMYLMLLNVRQPNLGGATIEAVRVAQRA